MDFICFGQKYSTIDLVFLCFFYSPHKEWSCEDTADLLSTKDMGFKVQSSRQKLQSNLIEEKSKNKKNLHAAKKYLMSMKILIHPNHMLQTPSTVSYSQPWMNIQLAIWNISTSMATSHFNGCEVVMESL